MSRCRTTTALFVVQGVIFFGCSDSSSSVPPLIKAAEQGSAADVARLLEQGADPNLRSGGFTPLRTAVIVGDPEKVEILLDAGADATEMLPAENWTLVMWAASERRNSDRTEESDLAVAQILVEAGAELCAETRAAEYAGQRASGIARTDGRLNLAAALETLEHDACNGDG